MQESFKIPTASFPSVSGAVCSFDSQYAGLPLKSHKIALTATQSGSGTPSPSNPRAISGHSAIDVCATGLNLWGGSYMLLTFIEMNLDRTFGYNEQELHFGAGAMSGYKVIIAGNFKPNTQYTMILSIKKSSANLSTNLSVLYTDNTRQILSFPTESDATVKQTLVFTTIQNKTVKAITGANGSGVTYLYYNECCLLEGVHTIDDFEPFGTYKHIEIGSTIYGGNYDAVSGVLTLTHIGVDLGSLTWTYESQYTRFKSNIIDKLSPNPNTRTLPLLCSCYEEISDGRPLSQVPNNAIYAGGETRTFYVTDSRYTDGNDLKTALFGQYVVYPILAPYTGDTIQLPPCRVETQVGVNNVFADTGDTTLQYAKFG